MLKDDVTSYGLRGTCYELLIGNNPNLHPATRNPVYYSLF
jgi:hypothetical protein